MNNNSAVSVTPLLSVIIPAYNAEKFVSKCLQSVINQTIDKIEIICINDGSNDGTLDIINSYASRDQRIVVIDNPHKGLSYSRNSGIKIAKGKFITFLDSDDWIDKNTYELALDHIHLVDLVLFDTDVVYDTNVLHNLDSNYYHLNYEGYVTLTDEVRLNTNVCVWNKIFHRDIILDNDIYFPENYYYEDYYFYWAYISLCSKAYYIKKQLYHYYRHSDSIMNKTFEKSPFIIHHLIVLDLAYNFFLHHDVFCNHDERNSKMLQYCFWFIYWNVPTIKKIRVFGMFRKMVIKWNLSDNFSKKILNRQYSQID